MRPNHADLEQALGFVQAAELDLTAAQKAFTDGDTAGASLSVVRCTAELKAARSVLLYPDRRGESCLAALIKEVTHEVG